MLKVLSAMLSAPMTFHPKFAKPRAVGNPTCPSPSIPIVNFLVILRNKPIAINGVIRISAAITLDLQRRFC